MSFRIDKDKDDIKSDKVKIDQLREAYSYLENQIQKMENIPNDDALDSLKTGIIVKTELGVNFRLVLELEELRELSSILYEEIDKSYIMCKLDIRPSKESFEVAVNLLPFVEQCIELIDQQIFDISDEAVKTVIGYIAIEGTKKSYEHIKRWIKKKENEEISIGGAGIG